MKLQDAEWIIPLLQAHLEGKTIQVWDRSVLGWRDVQNVSNVAFHLARNSYRIKPPTILTKRFLWKAFGGTVTVSIVDYQAEQVESREGWSGFIRWIDTEWQEVEV